MNDWHQFWMLRDEKIIILYFRDRWCLECSSLQPLTLKSCPSSHRVNSSQSTPPHHFQLSYSAHYYHFYLIHSLRHYLHISITKLLSHGTFPSILKVTLPTNQFSHFSMLLAHSFIQAPLLNHYISRSIPFQDLLWFFWLVFLNRP